MNKNIHKRYTDTLQEFLNNYGHTLMLKSSIKLVFSVVEELLKKDFLNEIEINILFNNYNRYIQNLKKEITNIDEYKMFKAELNIELKELKHLCLTFEMYEELNNIKQFMDLQVEKMNQLK